MFIGELTPVKTARNVFIGIIALVRTYRYMIHVARKCTECDKCFRCKGIVIVHILMIHGTQSLLKESLIFRLGN